MKVVYFDWNIYIHYRDWKFKGNQLLSRYKILEELKNSGQITTYYSDAHMLDLMSANSDLSFLNSDLKAITLLTGNICAVSAHCGEFKSCCTPEYMYNNVKKDFSKKQTPEAIRKGDSYIEVLLQPYLDSLADQTRNNLGPELVEEKLNAILEQMFQDHYEITEDPEVFRAKRAEQLKKLKTNPEIGKQLSGCEEEKLKVAFTLIPHLFKKMPQCMQNKCDRCLCIFLLLDRLGLWADSKYKNLRVDSLHAFYASHPGTDLFVTNDSNLIKKATIAYQVLGINQRIITFDEFEKEFGG
jgi:hypothetical protein